MVKQLLREGEGEELELKGIEREKQDR